MKRLLLSLLFGVLFPIFYLGLIIALVLYTRNFLSFPAQQTIDPVIGVLTLPVTWSIVISEALFFSNANFAKDITHPTFAKFWFAITNVTLYSTLFYLTLLLISRLKKSKQKVEQHPPLPPTFN